MDEGPRPRLQDKLQHHSSSAASAKQMKLSRGVSIFLCCISGVSSLCVRLERDPTWPVALVALFRGGSRKAENLSDRPGPMELKPHEASWGLWLNNSLSSVQSHVLQAGR